MAKYFDIDEILAEEERVPVKFAAGAYRLGHLDASSATEDIQPDQTMDLPVWLALPLKLNLYIQVDLPKNYSSKVRHATVANGICVVESSQALPSGVLEAGEGMIPNRWFPLAPPLQVRESLIADPDSVKLRDKSPRFYETGLKLASISGADDALKLPDAIKATLATRMHKILMRSHNSLNTDVSAFVNTLTDLEQALFWTGYAHVRDKLAWKKRLTTVVRKEGTILGSSGGEGLGIGAASKPNKKPRLSGPS